MHEQQDVIKLFGNKKLVKVCAPMVRYSKYVLQRIHVYEYNKTVLCAFADT